MQDHYSVLEISSDATEASIRQAYRKAALRWHPDKNLDNKEAEERFKAVANAYEVLSDTDKRRRYDESRTTTTDTKIDESFHGDNGIAVAFEVFERFFGGRDPFADFDDIFVELRVKRRIGLDVKPAARSRTRTHSFDEMFDGFLSNACRARGPLPAGPRGGSMGQRCSSARSPASNARADAKARPRQRPGEILRMSRPTSRPHSATGLRLGIFNSHPP